MSVGLVVLVMMALAVASQMVQGLPDRLWYVGIVIALYTIAAGIMSFFWFTTQRQRFFGWANRITFFRMLITVVLAALVPLADGRALSEDGREVLWSYILIAIATVGLLLDGVDGIVARRTQTTTDFGARFDMEVDAALILVLCGLLWRMGIAPAWVLAIGLMRYIFVAAAVFLPALNGPLAPSLRRKIICVVQVVSLVVCLHPLLGAEVVQAILFTALLILAGSFAKDSWDLLRVPSQEQRSVDD